MMKRKIVEKEFDKFLEQHRLEKYSEEFDSFGINSIDILLF